MVYWSPARGQYTFVKPDRHARGYKQNELTLSIDDLMEIADSCQHIVSGLVDIGDALRQVREP
jgi:hypothetical protein